VAFLYHCLILLGGHFDFINFLRITSFISLLNSSINVHLLYLLFLATLLNFCTNFSIILYSCSTLFNSTIFTDLLSPLLNSVFNSARKSLIILSELQNIDLVSFYFWFILYFWELGLGFSMMSHVIITNCHINLSQSHYYMIMYHNGR